MVGVGGHRVDPLQCVGGPGSTSYAVRLVWWDIELLIPYPSDSSNSKKDPAMQYFLGPGSTGASTVIPESAQEAMK